MVVLDVRLVKARRMVFGKGASNEFKTIDGGLGFEEWGDGEGFDRS